MDGNQLSGTGPLRHGLPRPPAAMNRTRTGNSTLPGNGMVLTGSPDDTRVRFEPGVTQTGALFIQNNLTPQNKNAINDYRTAASPILQEETKQNPDRIGFYPSFTSTPTVPVLQVRNNGTGSFLRQPPSATNGPPQHFPNHSRMGGIRKTLGNRLSWRCTAIGFIIVSSAFAVALACLVVALWDLHHSASRTCPVLVDGTVENFDTLKSTFEYLRQSKLPLTTSNNYSKQTNTNDDLNVDGSGHQQDDSHVLLSQGDIEGSGEGTLDATRKKSKFRQTPKHLSESQEIDNGSGDSIEDEITGDNNLEHYNQKHSDKTEFGSGEEPDEGFLSDDPQAHPSRNPLSEFETDAVIDVLDAGVPPKRSQMHCICRMPTISTTHRKRSDFSSFNSKPKFPYHEKNHSGSKKQKASVKKSAAEMTKARDKALLNNEIDDEEISEDNLVVLGDPISIPARTLPPNSESFSELSWGKRHSKVIFPFAHWNVQFQQLEPALVKFNYTLPATSSIAVYGRRNSIPTHTRYDFVEVLNARTALGRSKRSAESKPELVSMEFLHFMDRGRWYISVYNDGDQQEEIAFVAVIADVTTLPCPYDCHGHGTCNMGKCECDTDYAGDACAYRVCPVLCSSRGTYLSGACVCQPGWKGRECQLRDDECEVGDCSGHGECIDGQCRCFPGYKGQNCEEVDCLDPECSGHGVCVSGMCLCRKGWKSSDCSEPDSDALRCLPDCSKHGQFDLEKQRCVCDEQWSGPDCSQEKCDLDCGEHGRCQGNECECLEGWTGTKCEERLCDDRCTEHGQCKNGTCTCTDGYNGRHCTIDGCPNGCNSHGKCELNDEGEWACRCSDQWSGKNCGIPIEHRCNDGQDNDGDGLIDCADSECCSEKVCQGNPLCFSAADPLDILLRKQPPAVTASFFQRMQFLIEDDSVQSYANKGSFNDSSPWNRFNASRASVVRGQVVTPSGHGLMGVRISIASDQATGFTVTRDQGWFDLMVNGGGAVTLQFRRQPYGVRERTVMVPWNDIIVLDKVVMTLDEARRNDLFKVAACMDHDYESMKPVVLATWKHGFQGGCSYRSAILAESQVVQESLRVPGTDLHLVYHSSRVGGYLSTIQLRLTPDTIPSALRLIHLRITIEGILFEKTFEADPGILFTYAWNRRNIYRQKVYGVATAYVHVGYEYMNCPSVIWEVQTTKVSGHDMSISEIGGWNLDIHHRYNFHEGILQKGDGTNVYLKQKPLVLITSMGDGQQRSLHCTDCNGLAKNQRLLAPVALAAAPNGSIYVGDFNLIRQISPDGQVTTIVELSAAQVAYRYHLSVAPATGKLYISDPERHQVFEVVKYDSIPDVKNNIIAVVGSGSKCLPGDKLLCGDGRPARDAKLSYPKGIAISVNNEIFIADGTNIRYVDSHAIIHTLIGDHYHKTHWKPIPCAGTFTINQLNLRWPTELAINPLDGSLHILDDHMILRLTPDRRIKVVAGRPVHCPSSKVDFKTDYATEVFLEAPQGITFAPNGDLYIAESDSQLVNRVRLVNPDGKITLFAGAEQKCSCLELNCKCFDEEHVLASTSKFSTISSIAVTPDGLLHICDQGNLRIRSVTSSLPKSGDGQNLYEIYSPETYEIYLFNKYGQHVATKNIITGKTVYSFAYNVNTSFGKLNTVTDAAGNKVFILRDYSSQAKTIENSQGGKCQLEMTRMRMLQSFMTPENHKTSFDYQGSTGLIKSKMESSGKAAVYSYDEYGRLTEAITPSGQLIKLYYSLSIKGAVVTVTRDGNDPVNFLIKGSDVITRIGTTEERITLNADNSVIVATDEGRSQELETIPNPILQEQGAIVGEMFPVPGKLRSSLSDDLSQRLEWRFYLRREGKGKNKQITQVGRRMKINGDVILAMEFDREQYSEALFDRNQNPLVTVKYNAMGLPERWQPAQNATAVSLEYDRFGRLVKWQRGSLLEKYTYDTQGRMVDVRYADSAGIMYKYDENGMAQPLEIILPSGSRYILQYDATSSLQAIITPNGHKHEIATQTSLGFYKLLYLAPGVGFPYVMHFNDRGQILAKFYPKNKGRVNYIYNEEGRLDTIICGPERTDFYYHNTTSLVKSVTKNIPNLDIRTDYRHHGSILKEERHRYNSRSGLDSMKLHYVYEAGRLMAADVEINGRPSINTKFRFNSESGSMEQIQQFLIHRPKLNNIFIQDENRHYTRNIGTDTSGRLVSLSVTLYNKEIFALNLRYNNRGFIDKLNSKIGKDTAATEVSYNYTADGFLSEVVSSGQPWRFTYDINGNMKSIWEGPRQISLRHDAGDRLIGYGDTELYYIDERAFVIQRGEERFEFNAQGHLVHAYEMHQYDVQYFYDSRDRLTARKDHKGNITQFIYADPLRPNLVTHMHYPKDSLTLSMIYDTQNHLIFIQRNPDAKFYVATDHLGSPLAVFTSEGNVVKELQRNPFGKVIYDSNPDFFLPVDFQGGIRDPVTQLVHFGSRVYDSLGIQWLTPDWEKIPELIKKPYNIHLYRFHNNDPINSEAARDFHMNELTSWLERLGYNVDDIRLRTPSINAETILTSPATALVPILPVASGLNCLAEVVSDKFNTYSMVPRTVVKSLTERLPTISNLPSVLGDGILLSRNSNGRVSIHVVPEASPILRDVIVSVFNDSEMLDIHYAQHSQDSFYFVHRNFAKADEDWIQLGRLGTLFNITKHAVVDAEVGKRHQMDIRMHSTSVVINIRYGSTLQEERTRLLKHARRKAVEEAWTHEVELVKSGHRGSSHEWTKAEREELLSTGIVLRYFGTDIHDVTTYPQLADDPKNVAFRKEGSRKRRGKLGRRQRKILRDQGISKESESNETLNSSSVEAQTPTEVAITVPPQKEVES